MIRSSSHSTQPGTYGVGSYANALIEPKVDSAGYMRGSDVRVTCEAPAGAQAGFTIWANSGSPKTRAQIHEMSFYFGLPHNIASFGFTLTGASVDYWEYANIVDEPELVDITGTPLPRILNGAAYELHKFTYLGPSDPGYTVLPRSDAPAWPGSAIEARTTESVPLGHSMNLPPTIFLGHTATVKLDTRDSEVSFSLVSDLMLTRSKSAVPHARAV